MAGLDTTHDPNRKSWIDTANDPLCPFPAQNLPYGVFSAADRSTPRVGVAIGDQVLDLAILEKAGLILFADGSPVFAKTDIKTFMSLGPVVWTATRRLLSDLLCGIDPRLKDNAPLAKNALVPLSAAKLHLPLYVRSFTDFYASKEHATNVGAMFRDPQNALLPNWLHLPVGYNGRASTVVVSGTPIRRPLGQTKPANSDSPVFGPSRRLDFELELGAIVGTRSTMGEPITTRQADETIFGFVLLNDWSARDIQAWEYQPLGPFLSKAFATTISPWIVTRDALAPFRTTAPERIKPLLPYLHEAAPYHFDIPLEARLETKDGDATTLCRSNAKHLYYSAAQQLAHHAAGGCAMCVGDLLGSGTISGPSKDSRGCMLELTWNGSEPLRLPSGATRAFLDDGDTVTISASCAAAGYRVGFGDCAGTIVPAPAELGW